jgi:hypothetical protein
MQNGGDDEFLQHMQAGHRRFLAIEGPPLHRRLAIAYQPIGVELDQHVVEMVFPPVAGFEGMHQLHFDV